MATCFVGGARGQLHSHIFRIGLDNVVMIMIIMFMIRQCRYDSHIPESKSRLARHTLIVPPIIASPPSTPSRSLSV